MISGVTEDEAGAILRALNTQEPWTAGRIQELQNIVEGRVNAFEVIDALQTEWRRRQDE